MTADDAVAVVIPAYNAERTLDETLHSVRAQTHRLLDIVVVDDGSTDSTGEIASRHASEDGRVRLLRQANAGVATARNHGWRSVTAGFVAFCDADDLWAPTKIERQLAALRDAGPQAGVAYAWTVKLDAQGHVVHPYGASEHQGQVMRAIARANFVGSGSNWLVRRQALEDTGGFDASLQAAGAQGCEDWLFSCRVAEQYHFAVVPEYLVGYRHLGDSMSSNRPRMLMSHILMCRQMRERRPELADCLGHGVQKYAAWLLRDAIRFRDPGLFWSIWSLLWRHGHRREAIRVLWRELLPDPLRRVRNRLRRVWRALTGAATVTATHGLEPGRPFLASRPSSP